MKAKSSVLMQIIIACLVMILSLGETNVTHEEIILITVFIECVIISLKGKFFNMYQIFLVMIFFFNLAIPFFDLIGLYQYPSGYKVLTDAGISMALQDSTMVETFIALEMFLLGTSIGWLLWKDDPAISNEILYRKQNIMQSKDNYYKKFLGQLFVVLWPFEVLYQLIQVSLAIQYGYVEVIHLHSVTSSALSMLEYVDYIYPILGLSILYFSKDREDFTIKAVFYAIPYAALLLTGQRGTGISVILTLIFLYSYMYKQIRPNRIMAIAVVILFVIIGIGNYRWTRNVNDLVSAQENVIDSIVNEFTLNSESLMVISYTIELIDKFTNKIPFLFGYIAAIFSFSSNYTVEGILSKNYLAQHITYLLNPAKLMRGSTIGTSVLAEIYELVNGNYLLILVISILLLYMAGYFMKNMNRNILFFYFGFSYIQQLFMSPRGSVMKIFNKLSIAYIVIYLLMQLINRNKKSI